MYRGVETLPSRNVYFHRVRILLTVALVAAMLCVTIAPSLDLAPSVLSAWKAALVVLACLRLWLYLIAGPSSASTLKYAVAAWRRREPARGNQTDDLVDLLCARLC